MGDFTVGERNYRSRSIDAFTQLKIAKRILPIAPYFSSIAAAFAQVEALRKDDKEGAKQVLLSMIMPIGEALQKLPEDDFDYVINKCLSVTMIQEANIYTPIIKGSNFFYEAEIGAIGILLITVNVLVDNLASFSTALGSSGNPLSRGLTSNESK